MNRFVRRCGTCVAASVASIVWLLILVGCAARPNADIADIDFSVSNVSPDGSGAPSTGLQVDLHLFAANGRNPVRMEYTVTNIYSGSAVLAPIYVQYFSGDHIKIIDAMPVSGTAIAKSLKAREFVTGTITVQIEPMEWQEAMGPSVTTLIGNANKTFIFEGPEEIEARSKGGTAFALGGSSVVFRIKDGRIEVSRFGWRESEKPGFTTFDDGTRVQNPTYDPNVRPPEVTPEVQPTSTEKVVASPTAKP